MLDGKTHTINVESYKSVLEAALDEGIELPHDCKLGACLACAAKVLSGTVDQTGSTLDDTVIERGYALTCCAYPQSDVVIRSIPEDELIDEQFAPL
jgi:ferredoxin|eukprot:evm.model.NODE_4407_length_63659_cov_22.504595.24